jgi:hypothetical protein
MPRAGPYSAYQRPSSGKGCPNHGAACSLCAPTSDDTGGGGFVSGEPEPHTTVRRASTRNPKAGYGLHTLCWRANRAAAGHMGQ